MSLLPPLQGQLASLVIDPPAKPLALDLRPIVPELRPGAELRAVVQRSETGQLLLELEDGRQLAPRGDVPLRSGEQLQLRVTQTQPAIILQIVARQPPSAPVETALRTLLPSSGSRIPLTESVGQLLDIFQQTQIPSPMLQALRAVSARLIRPEQLIEAGQLAKALRDSGLMLERRLLSEPAQPPVQDLKAQLLQLAARLRATLNDAPVNDDPAVDRPTLAKLAESSERLLARLETLQLQAATARGLDLLFELPVQAGTELDRLQLRIQDEQAAGSEHAGPSGGGLLVRLRFEFAAIGAIGAVLRLADNEISLHWWAQQPATAAQLRAALPDLIARLELLELKVGAIDCSEGTPPPVDDLPILRRRGLLDEKV